MTKEDSFIAEEIFNMLKFEEKKFSIKFPIKKSKDKISKSQFHLLPNSNIKKIAEAGYSDVYLVNGKIFKIIPFTLTCEKKFMREVKIFKFLRKEHSIIQFFEGKILFGKYKTSFVCAFNEYERTKGSENLNPKYYDINLQYGLIIMEYGGISLEENSTYSFKILKNIFHQLVRVLYSLEMKYEFEHRDLHLGNILITDTYSIKIIDFSLSRIKIRNEIIYTDLSTDKNLFDGDETVDIQYGIYREMKEISKNDWEKYRPKTNILWIKYFLRKFEKHKYFKRHIEIVDKMESVCELYFKLKLK